MYPDGGGSISLHSHYFIPHSCSEKYLNYILCISFILSLSSSFSLQIKKYSIELMALADSTELVALSEVDIQSEYERKKKHLK